MKPDPSAQPEPEATTARHAAADSSIATRARQGLFPWRVGSRNFIVQLDPYYSAALRAWEVDCGAIDALYGAIREDDSEIWSALGSVFLGQRNGIDSPPLAGVNLEQVYKSEGSTRTLQDAAVRSVQPWLIYLELNQICNLSCDFCYVEKLPNDRGVSEILHLGVQRAAEAGAIQLTLTGGEPTLYPELPGLVRAATLTGMAITLRSNLLRLPKDIDSLAGEPRLAVYTSYHHSSDSVFDSIVGRRGARREIVRNIERLSDLGIRVCANIVLRNNNVDALDDMVEQLIELGIPYKLSTTLFPYTGARGPLAEGPLNRAVRSSRSRQLLDDNAISRARSVCTAAQSKLWLGCKGDVFPCELFREKAIGSFVNDDLSTILHTRELQEWRARTIHESEPSGCLSCGLRKKCPRCPAMVHMQHGHTRGKHDRTCDLTQSIHGQNV